MCVRACALGWAQCMRAYLSACCAFVLLTHLCDLLACLPVCMSVQSVCAPDVLQVVPACYTVAHACFAFARASLRM
jgi:hypothetical protein